MAVGVKTANTPFEIEMKAVGTPCESQGNYAAEGPVCSLFVYLSDGPLMILDSIR
jgi:hypothetical protein